MICEACKDQLIQYYMFYVNVKENDQHFIENVNLAKCKKYLEESAETDCLRISDCLLLVPHSKRKDIETKIPFESMLSDQAETVYRIDDSLMEVVPEHVLDEMDEIEIKVTDEGTDSYILTSEEHEQVSEINCQKSDFAGDTKDDHTQHVHTHLSSKRFNKLFCPRCKYQFTTQAHFTAHSNGHKIFDTLAKHMNIYPKCSTCNMMFIDDVSLDIHLSNHDEILPIESTGFFLKFGLRQESERQIEDSSGDSVKCGHCFESASSEENLVKHLLIFHAKQLVCPIDLRHFNNNQAFTIHMRNNHPELFPNDSFKCSVCLKEFDTLYEKLSHMKVCKEKAFNCHHCQKSFSRKCHLVKHLKLVSGELNISCQICNKVCRDKHDYKIHIQSHSTEKLFKCSLCEKSYKTSSARAAHLQSHLEIILCPYCNMQFKSRRTMQKHVKNKHERTIISTNGQSIEIY